MKKLDIDAIYQMDTPDQTLKFLRRVAFGLYLIALINSIIAIVTSDIGPAQDAWFILAFTATLQHCHSRAVSWLIVPYGLFILYSAVYCGYNDIPYHRSNTLGILMVFLGCNAIYAVHRYHHLRRSHILWKNAILKTIQALIYGFIFLLLITYGLYIPHSQELYELGGYPLMAFIGTIFPTIGMFLAFNGWLPFTHHEPACVYGDE